MSSSLFCPPSGRNFWTMPMYHCRRRTSTGGQQRQQQDTTARSPASRTRTRGDTLLLLHHHPLALWSALNRTLIFWPTSSSP